MDQIDYAAFEISYDINQAIAKKVEEVIDFGPTEWFEIEKLVHRRGTDDTGVMHDENL